MHLRRVRRGDADFVEVRDQCRNLAAIVDRLDARELFGQRLGSQRLERGLVHETGVQIGDLALIRIGGVDRCLQRVNQCVQLLLHAIVDQDELVVTALVCRNLETVDPLAVDVPVQIVLRPHTVIEILRLESGHQGRSGRGRGRRST